MSCFSIRAAVAVLVLVASATASAQSLADVARREGERRKALGTSGKVYTNDELRPEPPPSGTPALAPGEPSGTPAPAPVAPSTPAAGVPATGTPEGEPSPKPGDQVAGSVDTPKAEEAWRRRVAAERDAITRAQILVDALQSRINALTTDFENRDDPAQRAIIAADRQKALAELDRVNKELDQHRKTIPAIQEEARRAGVPAGWTR